MKVTKRTVWLVVDGSRIVTTDSDFLRASLVAHEFGAELFLAEKHPSLQSEAEQQAAKRRLSRKSA